jgi:hypothetical protein
MYDNRLPKRNSIKIQLRNLEVSGRTRFDISARSNKLASSYLIWNIKNNGSERKR